MSSQTQFSAQAQLQGDKEHGSSEATSRLVAEEVGRVSSMEGYWYVVDETRKEEQHERVRKLDRVKVALCWELVAHPPNGQITMLVQKEE